MAELKAKSEKARFGDVRDITAVDYVQEVNKAGEGIMVVLHLYKQVQYSCSKIFQKQLLNNFFYFFTVNYRSNFKPLVNSLLALPIIFRTIFYLCNLFSF